MTTNVVLKELNLNTIRIISQSGVNLMDILSKSDRATRHSVFSRYTKIVTILKTIKECRDKLGDALYQTILKDFRKRFLDDLVIAMWKHPNRENVYSHLRAVVNAEFKTELRKVNGDNSKYELREYL